MQGYTSHSHQNFSSSSNFLGYGILFNSPTPLAPARSQRSYIEGRNHCVCLLWWVFRFPQKKFRQGRGFDFLDGQTDRRTDGQTNRNFVEILGKLCFARLKLNLKTEDRFKLKTKLGYIMPMKMTEKITQLPPAPTPTTALAKSHQNFDAIFLPATF